MTFQRLRERVPPTPDLFHFFLCICNMLDLPVPKLILLYCDSTTTYNILKADLYSVKLKVKKATSISTLSVSFITELFALVFNGSDLLLLSCRSLSFDLHQQVFLIPPQIHLKCLCISCWQPALKSVCFLLSTED